MNESWVVSYESWSARKTDSFRLETYTSQPTIHIGQIGDSRTITVRAIHYTDKHSKELRKGERLVHGAGSVPDEP